jgi:nucleotide sugar dehydrogenase
MKVVVVGGGKIGLPLACTFAANGAEVTVCDIDRDLVATINAGQSPHLEPGLCERVAKGVEQDRIRADTDTAEAVAGAEAIVIIVDAKLTPACGIDYANLRQATADVAKGLRKGALVSFETTLPVGGCRQVLVPILEDGGLKAGRDFHVVFSPERVKSNLIFEHLEKTPKVVGGLDPASAEVGEAFYRRYLGVDVFNVGKLETAEFVKLAGMIYRDANIALANELASFAESMGIDFWQVLAAANTDGETFLLRPSIGVGGHCTPVYPYFLFNESGDEGAKQRIARLCRQINEDQPARNVARLKTAIGGLRDKGVHILGLAFRPGVHEDSYSPAFALRDALLRESARVTIEDPVFSLEEMVARGFTPGSIEAKRPEVLILNTAHAEYWQPDFPQWKASGVEVVLDGQALWDRKQVESAGLAYLGVGRPSE